MIIIIKTYISLTKWILINTVYLNKVKIKKKLMKIFIKKNDLEVN